MSQLISFHEFAPPSGKNASKQSIIFSVVVHMALIAALTWGVSWNYHSKNDTTQAELWSSIPQLAAPKLEQPPADAVEPVKPVKPVEIVPTPPPPPPPPPPQSAPSPAPAPPQPVDNRQAIKEAQLATARLKKNEEEKLEKERQAKILLENERLRKEKLEKEKADKLKAEKEKADKEKADKEKALKEKAEKEKAEKVKAEKEKAEKDKKAKEKLDAAREEKDAARKKVEDKKVEDLRQENLQKLTGMAGANGAPNSTGNATRSSGPSPSYAGRLKGRVKPNITYPEISSSENPSAEVLVRLAPDGTIISMKLTIHSGNPAWDAAVLNAIEKTERFPRDTDGSVPQEIVFTFKPNE